MHIVKDHIPMLEEAFNKKYYNERKVRSQNRMKRELKIYGKEYVNDNI